ncbi:light-harvesting protein [Dankookia sp. P2]|uniref:light-harvesting protein n=1 Tax=Dankookia sp. P2 TaxID=3423955 RepID=UPI003D66B026
MLFDPRRSLVLAAIGVIAIAAVIHFAVLSSAPLLRPSRLVRADGERTAGRRGRPSARAVTRRRPLHDSGRDGRKPAPAPVGSILRRRPRRRADEGIMRCPC